MNVLTICHNDPRLHPGGTEVLAWELHNVLDGAEGVRSHFLAATQDLHRTRRPGTAFQTVDRSANAQLIWCGHYNSFELLQADLTGVHTELVEFLHSFAPDIVHIHHTQLIGTDVLAVVRRHLPSAALVVTLHDYYPICHNDGVMVKPSGQLCEAGSVSACGKCFPDIAPSAFKVRELTQKNLLGLADRVIAPSAFLRDRFVAWGLDPAKLVVLRNGRAGTAATPHRALPEGGRRSRFAVFGNISRMKGTLLAVDAVRQLRAAGIEASLDLFGAPLFQGEDFQKEFDAALDAAKGAVRHHGQYRAEDLPRLMAGVDWVVVPSVWWENAPLVIQEAFQHRRPVICADIGGMAESVRDGVDGLHFQAGSVDSLAGALRRAVEEPGLWDSLADAVPPVRTLQECAQDHLNLYKDIMAERAPRRPAAGRKSAARAQA